MYQPGYPDNPSLPNPPTPQNAGEASRWEETRRRRRMLEGTWRDECHFRAGEELGRAGHTIPGLRHCGQAGRFARNCITHTVWRLPRQRDLTPQDGPERVAAARRGAVGR